MMTTTEKIQMFKEKRGFIKQLNKAFEFRPAGSTVESVDYEVYTKVWRGQDIFEEFVLVTFSGGSLSVASVNGNSNHANFRAIGVLLDGGHYADLYYYEHMTKCGYTKVEL